MTYVAHVALAIHAARVDGPDAIDAYWLPNALALPTLAKFRAECADIMDIIHVVSFDLKGF